MRGVVSLYPSASAGERVEWGSPVDGDELLRRPLLSRRGRLPTEGRSESRTH